MANSVDLDKTTPIGAVCYGSALFASILKVTAHSNNRNSKSSREVILGSVRL